MEIEKKTIEVLALAFNFDGNIGIYDGNSEQNNDKKMNVNASSTKKF